MVKCTHKNLSSLDDFSGWAVNVEGQNSNVSGMLMYKKYQCLECQKIITILTAVIGDTEK